MVDCTGFENRQARKGLGGSNPSLSATFSSQNHSFLKKAIETILLASTTSCLFLSRILRSEESANRIVSVAISQDEVVGGESGGDRGELGYRRDASEKHLKGFTKMP